MSISTELQLELELVVFGQPVGVEGRFCDGEGRIKVEAHVERTLGQIVAELLQLAVPGFEFELRGPWSVLDLITLRNPAFVLESRGVGFECDVHLAVPLIEVHRVGLWYRAHEADGEKSVDVELFGSFFGQLFDEKSGPLSWDALKEPAPPIGDVAEAPVFRLHYLGLGQHVALQDPPGTMAEVIDGLIAAGVAPGGKDKPETIRFERSSGWLFGLRLEALKMLSLSAVFNDPNLYGLFFRLDGEKAGALAGLSFEILYRRIGDDLGQYHAELELPETLRHIELAEVSIVLSTITVDVFTNGSFRIDLGFPHGLDFERSFAVEVFPFIGLGGMYFGVLDGRTSDQVPVVSNGTFAPVVVFGIGLQVGVGKTVAMGPLSAGIVVGVIGILEGALAVFRPDEPSQDDALYLKVTGVVGVSAHIYGHVDFGIIKASLDIWVYATATLVLESHEPALVVLEAGVSASLRIKIIFVTINLSFHATVRESFVIGERSRAPWVRGPRQVEQRMLAAQFPAARDPRRRVVQCVRWSTPKVKEKVRLHLYFVPQVTLALPDEPALHDPAGRLDGAPGGGPRVQLLSMVFLDAPDPDAPSPEAADPDAPREERPKSSFERLVDALVEWVLGLVGEARGTNEGMPTEVTLDEVEGLLDQLGDMLQAPPDAELTYAAALDFFSTSVEYDWPDLDPSKPMAVFPILTDRLLQATSKDQKVYEVNFREFRTCDREYRESLKTYFEELRVQIEEEQAGQPEEAPQVLTASKQPPSDSMAALLLVDYFRAILRQVLGDARDTFGRYELRPADGETLGHLVARFGSEAVAQIVLADDASHFDQPFEVPAEGTLQVEGGDDLETLRGRAHATQGLAAEDFFRALAPQRDVLNAGFEVNRTFTVVPVPPAEGAPIPEDPEVGLNVPFRYALLRDDTLESLLKKVDQSVKEAAQAAKQVVPEDVSSQLREQLASVTDLLRPGALVELPAFRIEPAPEDTLAKLAGRFRLAPEDLVQANRGVPLRDPLILLDCERLDVAGLRRTLVEGDTAVRAAAAVSRFFLHGLRLPDPEKRCADTERAQQGDGATPETPLYPLYRLTGQQWTPPDSIDGLVLERAKPDGQVEWQAITDRLQPALDVVGKYRELFAAAEPAEGESSPDPVRLDAALLLTRLDAEVVALTRLPPFRVVAKRYSLAKPIAWQSPAGAVELRPLPRALRAQLERPTADGHVDLRVMSSSPGSKRGGEEIHGAAPITRVDVTLQRVARPDGSGDLVPSLYEVFSGDEVAREDLRRLLDHLPDPATPGDVQVELAYAPANGGGRGLRSDALDPERTLLLQVDLSTFTRPPRMKLMAFGVGEPPTPKPPVAKLSEGRRFLELLWEACVTNGGGFLLDVRPTADGSDKLASIFDESGSADLSVLVTLPAAQPQGSFSPFHNAVRLPADPERGDAQLYVEPRDWVGPEKIPPTGPPVEVFAALNATQPGLLEPGQPFGESGYVVQRGDDLASVSLATGATLTDVLQGAQLLPDCPRRVQPDWAVRRATIQPGCVGFRLTRRLPDAQADEAGTLESLVALYHLLGFRVEESDDFRGSSEGLSLGPTDVPADDAPAEDAPAEDTGPWRYERRVPVAALASADPAESGDPYAGVGGTAELAFEWRDVYGNRCAPPYSGRSLSIPVRYSDPLLGPHQWPGIEGHYHVERAGDRAQLAIGLAFRPARYRPRPDQSFQRVLDRAEADRRIYRTACFQIVRDDIRFATEISLDRGQTYALARGPLIELAQEARRFVESVRLLRPATVRVTEKTRSLDALAQGLRVSAADLAGANQDLPGILDPNATIEVAPDRVAALEPDDTLREVAAQNGSSVAQLVERNHDVDVLAVDAELEVPWHVGLPEDARVPTDALVVVEEGDTFEKLARRSGVEFEELVSANEMLVGLLVGSEVVHAEDQNVPVDVPVYALGDVCPGDTLATLVERFHRSQREAVEEGQPVPEPLSAAAYVCVHGASLRLVAGARLLRPPRGACWETPLHLDPPSALVPLRAQLVLERPASAIDEAFLGEPSVAHAETELTPRANLPVSSKGAGDGSTSAQAPWKLRGFAESFEEALPRWKLMRGASGSGAADTAALVAVHFRGDELSIAREGEASFYAPPPISRVPWTSADGSVSGIDLDVWQRELFETLDRVLAPASAVRVQRLSSEIYAGLLDARKSLAESLVASLTEIVVTPDRSEGDAERGIAAAREVFRQRLLRSLSETYRVDSVVQHRIRVRSPWTQVDTAPRLYGTPASDGETFQLSEAKLELVDSEAHGGPSFLTFAVERTSSVDATHLELSSAFDAQALEFDLHDVAWADGYRASRWLSVGVPFESLRLGRADVPLPLRLHPAAPLLASQSLVAEAPDSTRLSELESYRCRLEVAARLARQDRLDVGFEDDEPASDDARRDGPTEALAMSLDAWASAAPELVDQLSAVAAFDGEGDEEAAQPLRDALQSLRERVDAVAQAWENRHGTSPSESDERLPAHPARLVTDGCGASAPVYESGPLNAVANQTVWGRALVRRNDALVADRATHPAFLLRSPVMHLPRPLRPALRCMRTLDVLALRPLPGHGSPRLVHRLATLFGRLVGTPDVPAPDADSPCMVQVRTSFEFPLGDRDGAGPALDASMPVHLWFPRPFRPDTDLGTDSGLCSELARALEGWLAENPAAHPGGRWVLGIALYPAGAGPSAGTEEQPAPFLEFDRLVIPLRG